MKKSVSKPLTLKGLKGRVSKLEKQLGEVRRQNTAYSIMIERLSESSGWSKEELDEFYASCWDDVPA